MRALRLHGDRDLRLEDIAPPPPPAEGELQLRIKAIALNHIDVWGHRGMAFAKRDLPLAVGVEAVGEVVAVGPGRIDDNGNRVPLDVAVGDRVIYSKYGGTEVKFGADEFLVLSARDVLAVVVR